MEMTQQLSLFQSLDSKSLVIETLSTHVTDVQVRRDFLVCHLSTGAKVCLKGFNYSETVLLWNYLFHKMRTENSSKVSFTWKEMTNFVGQEIPENAFKILFDKMRNATIAVEINSKESIVIRTALSNYISSNEHDEVVHNVFLTEAFIKLSSDYQNLIFNVLSDYIHDSVEDAHMPRIVNYAKLMLNPISNKNYYGQELMTM